MPLQPTSDVAVADWFVAPKADEWTRILMGPPGFEAYARVWFNLDGDDPDYVDDTVVLDRVRRVLAGHTTSNEGFFGFWDGSGMLQGHPAESLMGGRPTLHHPWRSYFLLTGALDDADAWALAGCLHLAWPADRAWFMAADVDPDWIGVGGTQALIDEILANPRLEAVPSAYDASDWESR